MLQIERDSGGETASWPHGTACAVGPRTLLTSGSQGCGLLLSRQRGCKLWASQPDQKKRIELREVRILADFTRNIQNLSLCRYYDLALLEVDEPLECVAPLVEPDQLSKLEDGMPLKVLGYPYEANKVTRFDRFPLSEVDARVFLVKTLPPSAPDAPRSLDVTAKLSRSMIGSPAFDPGCKLIGVFADSPAEADAKAVKDLQHMVVVSPTLLQRWLRDRDSTTWIVPEIQAESTKSEETASGKP